MDGSLCQWLQLHGKELGAGEDGEEILGNSFHEGLKYSKMEELLSVQSKFC